MTPPLDARRAADLASGLALGAMLATPFTATGGRTRRVLTTLTVAAGATRTAALEWHARGPRPTTVRALAAGLVSLAAEQLGSRTRVPFGRYRYTAALRPQIAGVPAVVPAAWYAMGVPSAAVGRAIAGSRRASAIGLGAVALTAWDLFLDPQMTGEGYWRWSDTGRYRGIPAANFAGWLAVSSVVVATVAPQSPSARSGAAEDVAPDHLVTYATVAVMETVAFATFFRDRVVAVVGGGAMLLLAGLASNSVGRRAVVRRAA